MSIRSTDVPRAFVPLLAPKRYKGAYGGRGGAKSHFFAGQLVLRCFEKCMRAVCIREVQNSIRESARQLIIDKIRDLGLNHFFTVRESEIRGKNGALIIFKGMQSFNAENIKSLEDYDVAWVEEAQSLSEKSLRLLRPTIRKSGSEIWCSWTIYGGKIHIKPAPAADEQVKYFYMSTKWALDSEGSPKTSFMADDDTFRLSEKLLELCMIWKWRANKGLNYAEDLMTYENEKEKLITADKGSRSMTVGRARMPSDAQIAYPGVIV